MSVSDSASPSSRGILGCEMGMRRGFIRTEIVDTHEAASWSNMSITISPPTPIHDKKIGAAGGQSSRR